MLRGVWPPDVIPADIDEMIGLYLMHERFGALPDPGGILDQDARTMEVWSVLAATMAEIREAIEREATTRARRGG